MFLNSYNSFCKDKKMEGVDFIDYAGYKACVLLENKNVRVVLGQHCGGRVLEYSWKGFNVITLCHNQNGYMYHPDKKKIDPYGGRLDIGPEMIIPKHPQLWLGKWDAKITGPRSARLISPKCESTGVRLVRDFKLDKNSSRLTCTQTIENISKEVKRYCHWSRTLLKPGGICIVPLTPDSRYPKKYIQYQGRTINYRPDNPDITIKNNFMEIMKPLKYPKLGIDTYAGWLAYSMPENVMFVKRFKAYPERVYGEIAGFPLCVYYCKNFIELEPIGPLETIKPGKSVSYTENWWFLPYKFPRKGISISSEAVADIIKSKTKFINN